MELSRMHALKCLSLDMEEMIKGIRALIWNGQIIPADFLLGGFLFLKGRMEVLWNFNYWSSCEKRRISRWKVRVEFLKYVWTHGHQICHVL